MIGRGYLWIIAVCAVLALVPMFLTSTTLANFLVLVLIISLAGQGWNVLGGVAGQYSFGHALFFGVGAYVAALLQLNFGLNAWLALIGGIAAGGLAGLVVGFLSFRAGLRGSYFALVTLAFAELVRILTNASDLTGGSSGLQIKYDPGLWNLQLSSRAQFMWLALAFVFVSLVLVQRILNTRFGAQLAAVRENEDAARALGINVLAVKLKAITLSGAMTAAAGVLYLQNFLNIEPMTVFGVGISVEALLAPMVGGRGLVLAPLIGAFTLHGLGEITKDFIGGIPGVDLIVFAMVLILVVGFARGGILGLLRKLASRLRVVKGA